MQVLVLKEATEVREVAVPPLALTAEGRAAEGLASASPPLAGSQGELPLALALQVRSPLETPPDTSQSPVPL